MIKLLLSLICLLVLGATALRIKQIDMTTANDLDAINTSQPRSARDVRNADLVDAVAWARCCSACQRNPLTMVQCIGF